MINYISFENIIAALFKAQKEFLFFAFFLMILNVYLQFLKWRVVCNSLLNIFDDKQILRSLFIGFSAGLVTPIRVGEYLGRKLALKEVGLLRVTISTILEKFASLFIVLIVGGIAATGFIIEYYSFVYSIPIILFTFVIILIVAFILGGYSFNPKWLNNLGDRYEFLTKIKLELSYVKEMSNSSIFKLIFLSLFFYVVILMQYTVLALAFEPDGNVYNFFVAGILILFVKSILSFLSFADLGVRESTSVFLLKKMGYTEVVGFNSAIFLFLFNLAIPSLVGTYFLLSSKSKLTLKQST